MSKEVKDLLDREGPEIADAWTLSNKTVNIK
jgi:hypothetical protein